MEESKIDRFKTGTKKLFGRTNERLKQKMGMSSDPFSKDDKWQVHVANFNRQQASGLKLHREVKGYIASLKTLENSTQMLLDAIREMHEYTWPGNMSLVKALQGLDKLTKELSNAMVDSMLVPVNNYIEVFPDIKERMNKRERKLLDYTRCKRSLDTIKKGDKISPEKLGLAQEEYTQHKIIYEELNNELCEDLPQFWNSRKPFITKFLDGFFKQNLEFHKEYSQVHSESYSALEPLKEALRKEPPYQKEIGDTDKYFVVTDNARKFKRQSLRKSFKKSGGGFKRSLSMGAMSKKTKREKDVPQSMTNLSVDPNPYVVPAQQATTYTPSKPLPAAKTSPPRPKPPRSPRNDYVNDTLDSEIESGATKAVDEAAVEPPTQNTTDTEEHDYAEVQTTPETNVEPATHPATEVKAAPTKPARSPAPSITPPVPPPATDVPVPAADLPPPVPDCPPQLIDSEVDEEIARICALAEEKSGSTKADGEAAVEPPTQNTTDTEEHDYTEVKNTHETNVEPAAYNATELVEAAPTKPPLEAAPTKPAVEAALTEPARSPAPEISKTPPVPVPPPATDVPAPAADLPPPVPDVPLQLVYSEVDEKNTTISCVLVEKSTTNDTSGTPFSPSIKVEPGTVVECIHEYKAVDDDELSFIAGDVVTVVAWDSTDEQDEGWFMGVLQGTGAKGAFPINYTRKHSS